MEAHNSRVLVAVLGATVLAAAALTGCAGNFNIKQTEPLRVHLEGDNSGTSSSGSVTVHVDTQSQPQQRVVVETTNETSTVTVAATVHAGTSTTGNTTGNTTSSTTIVNIVVQSNGETLGEQRVQADAGATKDVTLNVNVKGKSNVVIIMMAVQGTADVVVNAKGN